jgi:hypothetical protein
MASSLSPTTSSRRTEGSKQASSIDAVEVPTRGWRANRLWLHYFPGWFSMFRLI